jgi:hypothetical protein
MRQLLKHGMLAAILSLALPLSAQAWGPEGHEIVSEIALFHLTPAARAAVDDVLGAYKLSHYDVASWPDAIRGSKEYAELYPQNGRWHFIEFDAGLWYDEHFELRPPEDGHDIVTQIRRWHGELKSGPLKGERRLDALRFLVHFVGDVHQPLHCAFRYGDMGGNMLPVNSFMGRNYSFGPEDTLDDTPNLHSTWDEYLVHELVAGRTTRDVVRSLQDDITADDIRRWMHDDVLQWAVDSYWIARKKAYRMSNGDRFPYKWARPGMDLTRENYNEAQVPVVAEQLQKAGVRLAFMLNTALDPDFAGPPPAPDAENAQPASGE